MTRRILPLLLALAALAGCGGKHQAVTHQSLNQAVRVCPQAAAGQGHMGSCAPRTVLPKAIPPSRTFQGDRFADLSNNDPATCSQIRGMRNHGLHGLILKANQGAGFIDAYFVGMARCALALHLPVGGYDFVQDYTTQEAYTFIARLHAAGIWRSTPHTFPPTLDVEFGAFSGAGLRHMIAVLLRSYGWVQVYTGGWYWTPHYGCGWPGHASAWFSGYPRASLPCGVPSGAWVEHQYTDNGYNGASYSDMSVWLGSHPEFAAFTHTPQPHPKPAPPKPRPRPARDRRILALYAQRRYLRGVLLAQHCRVPHPSRHCAGLLHQGATRNHQIAVLHAAHIY